MFLGGIERDRTTLPIYLFTRSQILIKYFYGKHNCEKKFSWHFTLSRWGLHNIFWD